MTIDSVWRDGAGRAALGADSDKVGACEVRAADDVALAERTNRVDGAGRKRKAASRTRRDSSCPPGRPRLGCLAACSLAAAFLAVFAVDLALFATPAQAQTTVWSATLTPRVTFSGTPVPLGCDNTSTGNRRCSNSNTLSDDFTDDGTTYAVTKFFTRDGVLTFRLDTGATAATQGLTLVIDGAAFVLKEADQINGGKTQWKWNNTTLGWTAGTDVAVSLVATDAPATGQPTISGGGQVGKTLTAATDDIEDPDGLPTTPTFTYQWVRVDGSTDTDIPGAASETYTLTASDLGKQIKVTVSFTDFRGHAEGPLTSDAYPPNGTVVALPGPCASRIPNSLGRIRPTCVASAQCGPRRVVARHGATAPGRTVAACVQRALLDSHPVSAKRPEDGGEVHTIVRVGASSRCCCRTARRERSASRRMRRRISSPDGGVRSGRECSRGPLA